jgi:hypothetical protein
MAAENMPPSQGKLYAEGDYAVEPHRFPAEGLDAVARWLMETFQLQQAPDVRLVRHIYDHPQTGLVRFVKERKGEDLPPRKLRAIETVHIPAVEQIKQSILRKMHQNHASAAPLYALDSGPSPVLVTQYNEEQPQLARWASTELFPQLFTLEEDPQHFLGGFASCAERLDRGPRNALLRVLETLRGELESAGERTTTFPLWLSIIRAINNNFLREYGLIINSHRGSEPATPENFFHLHRLHEEHIYRPPSGKSQSATQRSCIPLDAESLRPTVISSMQKRLIAAS